MLDPEIIRSFDPRSIEYDSGDDLLDADPAYPEEIDEESAYLTEVDADEESECLTGRETDYKTEDPEEDYFFSDETTEEPISAEPKASWPEVKAALNHWGNVFSSDSRLRSEAAEQIFSLFGQVTFSYKTLLDYNPTKENERKYANAVKQLHTRFFGEQEAPLRFLKKIYPEDLFYSALYHTLGINIDKDPAEDPENGEECFTGEAQLFDGSSAYDSSKGATYTTYFVSTLRFFCLRRARKLSRDHALEQRVFAQNTQAAQLQESANDAESQVIRAEEQRRQLMAMVSLGELVLTAKYYGQKLPIKSTNAVASAKKPPKSVKPHQLELFYSFKLVNFSRFSTRSVDQKSDLLLMHAADPDFLRFSTTIQGLTYAELVDAALSQAVLEQKLCDLQDGEPVLQQNAAAVYIGTNKSEITRIFNAAKAYLRGSWNFLLQD